MHTSDVTRVQRDCENFEPVSTVLHGSGSVSQKFEAHFYCGFTTRTTASIFTFCFVHGAFRGRECGLEGGGRAHTKHPPGKDLKGPTPLGVPDPDSNSIISASARKDSGFEYLVTHTRFFGALPLSDSGRSIRTPTRLAHPHGVTFRTTLPLKFF